MDYKKMMTVAGALICASAMAGVESSVVGYQNVNGAASQKAMIGATFQKIAGTGMTLGDVGVNESFVELSDTLTLLDEYGGAAGVYVYMTATTAADFGIEAGWYDNYEMSDWDGESPIEAVNIALPAGKGFMLQVADDGAAVIVPAAL